MGEPYRDAPAGAVEDHAAATLCPTFEKEAP
jgi:hypothetical protein